MAVFLLGLMPQEEARKIPVSMSTGTESRLCLINIVSDFNENSGSFAFRYKEGRLIRMSRNSDNPIRRAFCDYLAELYLTDRTDYIRKLGELSENLSEVYKHNLPPETLLYCLWAGASATIHLKLAVSDAIRDFLAIVKECGWNDPNPKYFFRTMQKMSVMYLNGFNDCTDTAPAGKPREFRELLNLLSAECFPAAITYPIFLAGLIKYVYDSCGSSRAQELFGELQAYSGETAEEVSLELKKYGYSL